MGLIPGRAQWVRDPALPQLWLRAQVWLPSDPWPGTSICRREPKMEKKFFFSFWPQGSAVLDVGSSFPDQGLNLGHKGESIGS